MTRSPTTRVPNAGNQYSRSRGGTSMATTGGRIGYARVAAEDFLRGAAVRGDRSEHRRGPTPDELVEARPEGLRHERVDEDELVADVGRDAADELRPVADTLRPCSGVPRRMARRPPVEARPQLAQIQLTQLGQASLRASRHRVCRRVSRWSGRVAHLCGEVRIGRWSPGAVSASPPIFALARGSTRRRCTTSHAVKLSSHFALPYPTVTANANSIPGRTWSDRNVNPSGS